MCRPRPCDYNKLKIKGYSLSPGPRWERLAAVVKENLMEIPVVIIPNHAPGYHFLRWIFPASPLHASARLGRPMGDRSVSAGYSTTRLSGAAFRTTARGIPVSNVTSLPSCSTARASRYMSVSCLGP
jgi:hypothetical protein